jgi:murein DD-endopeptidase MepM/ murein hydrolase activator NlpD
VQSFHGRRQLAFVPNEIESANGSDYTYDGHLGIDTEIAGFTAQAIGVPIFAALDGMVVEAHDGEPDMNTVFNTAAVANYVKLDHGNGQTKTYDHMKNGSVAVIVGQQVTAGQQIGLTASSGFSTGPHLHLQSEVNGVVFEPFSGSARPGLSAWVSQPPFRTDTYVRQIVITDQDLSTWPGPPFDTTRKGTFFTGLQTINSCFHLATAKESRTSL